MTHKPQAFLAEPIFRVVKDALTLSNGIDIHVRTFLRSCPLILGINFSKNDTHFLFSTSSKISSEEEMALGAFDPKTNKMMAFVCSMTLEGKKKQMERLLNYNYEEPNKIKVLLDLFEKIDHPIVDYPNPAYLFSIGVDPDINIKGVGNKIFLESLNYWKSRGHKSMFAEATSIKSTNLFVKHGAKIMTEYKYENYTKETGFEFLPVSKDESFRHVRILF